jgi:hypothetical protein
VNAPRTTLKSRSARARKQFWMRFGVWVFLLIFAFSVVGGVFILFR